MIDEENKKNDGPVEIVYTRAKFTRRLFANLVDLLIFALLGICCFLAVRAIYCTTPDYIEKEAALTQMKLDSALYVDDEGQILDVAGYLSASSEFTAADKVSKAKQAIEDFIDYAYQVEGEEVANEITTDYHDFFLDKYLLEEPYFIMEGGELVENPECIASKKQYFENVYTPFINEHCQGYLTTRITPYLDLTKYISNILLFVEVPISYCLSGILTYYVPTWIFRRGRKTFGKALYRIGTVDGRMLNPTWKRSLARFAIFYFAILIFSVFSFAIPAIISVTLMGFSKKRQGFADYLLDLQEVDTTNMQIFYSLSEAQVSGAETHRRPISFESVRRE